MIQLSVRQVLVGTRPAGMHGLDELFEKMYAQERQPDEPRLGLELARRARAHNYIPKGVVPEYAEAQAREYRQYVGLRESGGQVKRTDQEPGADTLVSRSHGFPQWRSTYATGAARVSSSARFACIGPRPTEK